MALGETGRIIDLGEVAAEPGEVILGEIGALALGEDGVRFIQEIPLGLADCGGGNVTPLLAVLNVGDVGGDKLLVLGVSDGILLSLARVPKPTLVEEGLTKLPIWDAELVTGGIKPLLKLLGNCDIFTYYRIIFSFLQASVNQSVL